MTADKTPIEEVVDQALDAFVYAPIGFLFDGPAPLPKLVRNGRSQVTNARMMGQFAVQMGRSEVTKRAAELDGPIVDLLRGLGVIDGPPPGSTPAPTPTADAVPQKAEAPTGKQGSAKAPAPKKPPTARKATKATKKRTATKATTAPSAASASALAITDYDSLSASQVVSRLQGLSTAELEAVRSYEAATRGRKTILNRVQQLQKP